MSEILHLAGQFAGQPGTHQLLVGADWAQRIIEFDRAKLNDFVDKALPTMAESSIPFQIKN